MTPNAMTLCATFFVGALLSGSMMGDADAQRRRARGTTIAIGETSAPLRLRGALRDALRDELGVVDGVEVTNARHARYVLRGSVTRIDTEPQSDRIECEVSLILADRRGGNIRLILEGRAGARRPQGAAEVARLRPEVVRAAVRGALRPLGQQPLR